MQGQGIYVERAQCRSPVAMGYHAPQAQPCLSYVEICIGVILVADLVRACVCVWGASKPVRFATNRSAAMPRC